MAKLALVFPGQGSQAVGMGAQMALKYESAARLYRRADELLGWRLTDLSFNGPREKLDRTEFAQPALYVNSLAAMAALRDEGVAGDVVAGHSLGEYSALAASGAVGFEAGLELVARRGEAMGRAARERPGAMAAVLGLGDERVEEICAAAGEVWAVNFNSPGQVVISGEAAPVRRAMEAAREAGAKKVVELAVSGSFHSPLMLDAARAMKERLAGVDFRDPAPPFFSSITCRYEGADTLAEALVRQIVSPVRWRRTVERLITGGVDRFLEVGSGKVLCGLIRRIDRSVTALSVSDPDSLNRALGTIMQS